MSKKETKSSNGSLNISEISTIRDILMGQQISEFESRMIELQERIESLENQLEYQSQAMSKASAESTAKFESMVQNKVSGVGKKVEKQVEKLNAKMDRTSKSDKELIGKFLAELGQKLINTK